MGRATIKENLGDGQYNVTIDRNLDVLNKEYDRILADIGDIIENRRPELETRSADLQTEINSDKANINAIIDALNELLAQGLPEAGVDDLLARIASVQITINLNTTALEDEQAHLREIESELQRDDLTEPERGFLERAKYDSEFNLRFIVQLLNEDRAKKKELQDQFKDNPIIHAELSRLTLESKSHQVSLTRHLSEKSLVDRQLADMELRLVKHGERLDFIDALRNKKETKNLWCADLTEEMTGEVATIEVPGENVEQLVVPGFQANGRWENSHGLLTPVACMTPASYFYNLAMLPGWQTFKPLYRLARITKITDGKANVVLLDDKANKSTQPAEPSDAEKIDIAPRSIIDGKQVVLNDLPFEYMDCNEEPFAVDDEVVVYFAERTATSGRVIGFRKNPKPCRSSTVYVTTTGGRIDSTRVKLDENDNPAWAHAKNLTGKVAAPAYWTGTLGSLSWKGPHTRHIWCPEYFYPLSHSPSSVTIDEPPGPQLYHKGALMLAPGTVIGACIHEATNKFVVITADGPTHLVYASPRDSAPTWTQIGSYQNTPAGSDGYATVGGVSVVGREPWFFNRDGSKACSVRWRFGYHYTGATAGDAEEYGCLRELTLNVVPATEESPETLACSFNDTLLFTTEIANSHNVDDPCVDSGPFQPYGCTVTTSGTVHYTRPIVMAEYNKDNQLVTLGDETFEVSSSSVTYGPEMNGGYDGCQAFPDTERGSTHSSRTGGSESSATIFWKINGALNFTVAQAESAGASSYSRSFCFVDDLACSIITDSSGGSSSTYLFNILQHVNLGADEIVLVTRSGTGEQSVSQSGHTIGPFRPDDCGPGAFNQTIGASMNWTLQVNIGGVAIDIAEESFPNINITGTDDGAANDDTQAFYSMLRVQEGVPKQVDVLRRCCVYVHPTADHIVIAEQDVPVDVGTVYIKPALGDLLDGNLEQQATLGVG